MTKSISIMATNTKEHRQPTMEKMPGSPCIPRQDGAVRKMRGIFRKYKQHLATIAIVARKSIASKL